MMRKITYILNSLKRFIFIAAFLVPNMNAYAAKPTLVFFDASKSGEVASQTIYVKRESGWEAKLGLIVPTGLSIKDPKVVDILNLADDVSGGDATPLKPHKGISLNLTVRQIKDGKKDLILEKIINNERLSGFGYGVIWLHIDGFRLLPGRYEVNIKILNDDLRFSNRKIALSVGTNPLSY